MCGLDCIAVSAGLQTKVELEGFAAELIDRFGELPKEVNTLLLVVRIKAMCKRAGIAKLDGGPKGATIQFHNDKFARPRGWCSSSRTRRGWPRSRTTRSSCAATGARTADKIKGAFAIARDLAEKVAAEKKAQGRQRCLKTGLHDVPAGHTAAVVTHLEMRAPAAPRPEADLPLELRRVAAPAVRLVPAPVPRGRARLAVVRPAGDGARGSGRAAGRPGGACPRRDGRRHRGGAAGARFPPGRECELAYFLVPAGAGGG